MPQEEMSREKLVIVTTHLDIGLRRLLVLEQGRVVYSGRGEDLLRVRFLFTVRTRGGEVKVTLPELNRMLPGVEIESVAVRGLADVLKELLEREQVAG